MSGRTEDSVLLGEEALSLPSRAVQDTLESHPHSSALLRPLKVRPLDWNDLLFL